jgi:hypothetical protein
MIFGVVNKPLPKCKNAKFIRIPSICRLVPHKYTTLAINNQGILDLFTLGNIDYETTFYIVNSLIKFINRTREEFNKFSIVPLFDYKNAVYDFLSLNREKYNTSEQDEAVPEKFVKSPNGDLYYMAGTDFLTIYNLTKGKVLFDSEKYHYYLFPFLRREGISSNILYSSPILNSFIVIMRIVKENGKFRSFIIYIVDLVKGVVKNIEYDLGSYIIKLIYNVQDYLFNLFDDALRNNSLKESDRKHFTPEGIFQNSRLMINKWKDCKITKYQNVIPVYDYCSFKVTIILESKIPHTNCVFNMHFNIKLLSFLKMES